MSRSTHVHRRNRYGIGPRDFWDLFYYQKGLCALCGLPMDPNHKLDLDHEGGRRTWGDWRAVRGILHWHCNSHVNDNSVASARQVLRYLRHPPAWKLWPR